MTNAKHSAASHEWYTPKPVVDMSRKVLGGIDFDPFSSAEANETVKARRWLNEGGFELDNWPHIWSSLFINPPGGKTGNKSKPALAWQMLMDFRQLRHAIFIAFSIESLQVTQNCSRSMMGFPLCVPAKRLRFESPAGKKVSPTHAQAIVYIPGYLDETNLFIEVFSDLGKCKR